VRQFIGKYAYAVVLEVFAVSALSPRDAATFAVHVQRTSALDTRIRSGLQKFTTITPHRTSFYHLRHSLHDRVQLALEVLFLVMLALHTRGDVRQLHVCWAQHGHLLKVFMYHWNNIQVWLQAPALGCVAVLLSRVCLASPLQDMHALLSQWCGDSAKHAD
jgi:hypothetical protein